MQLRSVQNTGHDTKAEAEVYHEPQHLPKPGVPEKSNNNNNNRPPKKKNKQKKQTKKNSGGLGTMPRYSVRIVISFIHFSN